MKSKGQIIAELNKISLIDKITDENHALVKQTSDFYEKYPQYSELEADGVFFVLASIRTKKKPVKAYKYTNGDILFVGDIITATNAPIAGIGNGVPLPFGFDWNNIEKTSNSILSFAEEITWDL